MSNPKSPGFHTPMDIAPGEYPAIPNNPGVTETNLGNPNTESPKDQESSWPVKTDILVPRTLHETDPLGNRAERRARRNNTESFRFDEELRESLMYEYMAPQNKHKSIQGEVERLMRIHSSIVQATIAREKLAAVELFAERVKASGPRPIDMESRRRIGIYDDDSMQGWYDQGQTDTVNRFKKTIDRTLNQFKEEMK